MINKELDILGVRIKKTIYSELLETVNDSLKEQRQTTFTSANVNTINLTQSDLNLLDLFNKIDIIHPDGIGVFLASKFLFGQESFLSRITGSDFYKHLINLSLKNNWSFYFFGDKDETLNKIYKLIQD